MSSTQFQIFLSQTRRLVQSLTLHCPETALAMNEALRETGQTVLDDRATWRYYLHLEGLYHDADQPMTVLSRDTLTTISFDRETLVNHPLTQKTYAIGSAEYNHYLSQYPEQELLIRGILSPVPRTLSVSAGPLQILDYERSLVEDNESTLMMELQAYLTRFYENHHNRGYLLSDNLYWAGFLGTLFLTLPPLLMALRLDRCLTSEVHSYHLWSYLSGFAGLDAWKYGLDNYQARYLYRNIRWLLANTGARLSFTELVRVLLTRKDYPLFAYEFLYENTSLTDQLYPTPVAVRRTVDAQSKSLNLLSYRTPASLQQLMKDCAVDNDSVLSQAQIKLEQALKRSPRHFLQTKVLETELLGSRLQSALRLRQVAYQEWVSLSARGLYSSSIAVVNAKAQLKHQLSPPEALLLFHYCADRLLGSHPVHLPTVQVGQCRRPALPSLLALSALVSDARISEEWLIQVRQRQVAIQPIYSLYQFQAHCQQVLSVYQQDERESESFHTLRARAESRLVIMAFREAINAIVLPITSYAVFFKKLQIEEALLTDDVCQALMADLFQKSTGVALDLALKDNRQEQLVALLKHLSSYGIQFITTSTMAQAQSGELALLRMEPVALHLSLGDIRLYLHSLSVLRTGQRVALRRDWPARTVKVLSVSSSIYERVWLATGLSIREHAAETAKTMIRLPSARPQRGS